MSSPLAKMNDLVASYVRTGVMLVVGWVLAEAGRHGLHIDISQTTLDVVATGAYYLAIRGLEHYVDPRFGWLLGLAKKPQYADAAPVAEGDAAP